ncbi:hypothetical protein [Vibrio marisflavi]|nr:hypothetical protein [Vibrio marisflavi]
MSDDYNKPKNVSELGVTFEERLAQLGKLSKHSRGDGKNARTPISNQQNRGFGSADASDTSVIANPKSRAALDEYKQRGQSKQILKVWFMLMQAFGSKLKHFFGDEPDVHFMKFAVSLTADSYKRLEANLLERLDEDREWPPSLIRLRQLAESPTKEMMYRARQKLFHYPVPMNELDRVEQFIKKYKMREVKNFSERNFELEFNRKFTQWFREVILEDMDVQFDEIRKEMNHRLECDHFTENDKHIDDVISEGNAFNNPFGERIQKMLQEKHAMPEALSDQEASAIERRCKSKGNDKSLGDA